MGSSVSQVGEAILDDIEAQGYDTLTRKPEVSESKKARLLAGAVWGKIAGLGAKAPAASGAGK